MARKRGKADEVVSEVVGDDPAAELQRPPAASCRTSPLPSIMRSMVCTVL